MPMPDDFNPNAPEPVERSCPECGWDGGSEYAEENRRLKIALRSLVRAWEDPGPMGTMMEMPEAVSYAKSVLGET